MKTKLFIFAMLWAVVMPAAAGNMHKYLMHSSCMYLSRNASDGKAVLAAATNAKPLDFVQASDGSYTIQLDVNGAPSYLGLGTVDGWSTYFLSAKAGGRTVYTIEQANGEYVKLRNQQTGKYLGTDNTSAGSAVYSDKSGSEANHLWFLADQTSDRPAEDTIAYSIHAQATRQQMEGWGVSLCWWANMCGKWSDEKIDQLVDWMVSPTGLNWNIFRYNIGGGDDPLNRHCDPHHMGKGKGLRAEMEGFQDEPGGDYIWSRDEAQRKIMLKIKERRPDAIFEAFSNSAPWWMTYSGCCAGNVNANDDNLKPEYYEAFAQYLVDVCKHYKDIYGIEFKTLEPFNEPVTPYWGANGGQEGCHFSTVEQVKFLKVLKPILDKSGLNTIISSSDETDSRQSVVDFNYYKQQNALPLVGQWNTHTYSATDRSRSQVGSLARNAGIPVWMSEVGAGGTGLGGNLNLCQKFFDDMHYILPSAWVDWQFVEENNDQWCLARGNFADENSIARVPNYYVRQQVTRFIRQGYTMVSALSNKALAAINPTGDTLVVVMLNNTATQVHHRIQMPGVKGKGTFKAYRTTANAMMQQINASKLDENGQMKVALPALSILTMVMPVEVEPLNQTIETGATYLIVPQSNCNMAISAIAGKVTIQPANLNDKRQQWTIKARGSSFTFTNGEGQILTPTDYALTTKTVSSAAQSFSIKPVEDFFYKIVNTSGKGFDLQGNGLTEGTVVGVYKYGNSVDADTRNWQFIRISPSTGDGISASTATPSRKGPQYYDLHGRRLNAPTHGVNICLSEKGVSKVLVPAL
ncbi:MAG: glycoside hydrolase [Bacteroidaceae bacterium]